VGGDVRQCNASVRRFDDHQAAKLCLSELARVMVTRVADMDVIRSKAADQVIFAKLELGYVQTLPLSLPAFI
jgi:hypothetical protein